MKKEEDKNWGRIWKDLRQLWHRGHLAVIVGIITFYILCCLLYWYVEFDRTQGTGFLDVLLWNTATLFGQDFAVELLVAEDDLQQAEAVLKAYSESTVNGSSR